MLYPVWTFSFIECLIYEQDVSSTTEHHLLYTRFRSVATKISPLLGELERRARAYPEDLSGLLEECSTAYLAARRQLLTPRLIEEIRGLDPAKSDLVELVSFSHH